jgi:L,D-peptidoglycan transpeptidase YkuD (ErfK/YbiS/YcfS/YnhG family)
VLENARQLALVVTKGMNARAARMNAYERDAAGDPWRPHGAETQVVVGASGLGWGWTFASAASGGEPIKTEGDMRSPAGFFPIGAPFGFAAAPLAGHLTLSPGKTFCVDDPRSPHYGRIVSRADAGVKTSGEDMASISLYRFGLVVDYPPNATAKAGSCIFIHIWRSSDKGTSGCVAMAEKDVRALQAWTRPGESVIAVLPEKALAKYAACLPGVVR